MEKFSDQIALRGHQWLHRWVSLPTRVLGQITFTKEQKAPTQKSFKELSSYCVHSTEKDSEPSNPTSVILRLDEYCAWAGVDAMYAGVHEYYSSVTTRGRGRNRIFALLCLRFKKSVPWTYNAIIPLGCPRCCCAVRERLRRKTFCQRIEKQEGFSGRNRCICSRCSLLLRTDVTLTTEYIEIWSNDHYAIVSCAHTVRIVDNTLTAAASEALDDGHMLPDVVMQTMSITVSACSAGRISKCTISVCLCFFPQTFYKYAISCWVYPSEHSSYWPGGERIILHSINSKSL